MKVPRELNATVGQSMRFTVQVTATSDDVIVALRSVSPLPPDSTFDPYTGVFTWTPRDTNVVAIEYVIG